MVHVHTSKKIQQVIDTEPSSPDAASRGVRGTEISEPMLMACKGDIVHGASAISASPRH